MFTLLGKKIDTEAEPAEVWVAQINDVIDDAALSYTPCDLIAVAHTLTEQLKEQHAIAKAHQVDSIQLSWLTMPDKRGK
jgi:hypothetical protein